MRTEGTTCIIPMSSSLDEARNEGYWKRRGAPPDSSENERVPGRTARYHRAASTPDLQEMEQQPSLNERLSLMLSFTHFTPSNEDEEDEDEEPDKRIGVSAFASPAATMEVAEECRDQDLTTHLPFLSNATLLSDAVLFHSLDSDIELEGLDSPLSQNHPEEEQVLSRRCMAPDALAMATGGPYPLRPRSRPPAPYLHYTDDNMVARPLRVPPVDYPSKQHHHHHKDQQQLLPRNKENGLFAARVVAMDDGLEEDLPVKEFTQECPPLLPRLNLSNITPDLDATINSPNRERSVVALRSPRSAFSSPRSAFSSPKTPSSLPSSARGAESRLGSPIRTPPHSPSVNSARGVSSYFKPISSPLATNRKC